MGGRVRGRGAQGEESGDGESSTSPARFPIPSFLTRRTPPRLPSFAQAVKVNSLGKWKTALQMVAMSAILVLRRAEAWLPRPKTAAGRAQLGVALATGMRASLALLWAGTFLAVLSLYYYMANVWHFFLYPDGGRPASSVPAAAAASPPRRAAALPSAAAAAAAAAPPAGRGRTRRAAAGR